MFAPITSYLKYDVFAQSIKFLEERERSSSLKTGPENERRPNVLISICSTALRTSPGVMASRVRARITIRSSRSSPIRKSSPARPIFSVQRVPTVSSSAYSLNHTTMSRTKPSNDLLHSIAWSSCFFSSLLSTAGSESSWKVLLEKPSSIL